MMKFRRPERGKLTQASEASVNPGKRIHDLSVVADFKVKAGFARRQSAAGANLAAGIDGVVLGGVDFVQAGVNADIAVAVVEDDHFAVAFKFAGKVTVPEAMLLTGAGTVL